MRNVNANVTLGIPDPKTGRLQWTERDDIFAMQGFLQADIDVEIIPEFRLRLRAKGYEPVESRLFKAAERQVGYDVELIPSDKPQGVIISGVVHRPDGTPLAGAEVAITYPMAQGGNRLPSVRIKNGKIQTEDVITTTRTDAKGAFNLGREPDPEGQHFAIVVVHPEFYAEVDRDAFEANPTVLARPWGRIEGVARIGSSPAGGESIEYFNGRLINPDAPYLGDQGETRADAQGRFVLDHVAPGDVKVRLGFGEKSKVRGWSSGTLLEVKPGQTTQAVLGERERRGRRPSRPARRV